MVRIDRSLADLREGESGTIRGLDGDGPLTHRLLDLGFVPGTPVHAICRAPLGDPITFSLRGYRIGLRAAEAGLVRIEELVSDWHDQTVASTPAPLV